LGKKLYLREEDQAEGAGALTGDTRWESSLGSQLDQASYDHGNAYAFVAVSDALLSRECSDEFVQERFAEGCS
jgi:hypothetical protein